MKTERAIALPAACLVTLAAVGLLFAGEKANDSPLPVAGTPRRWKRS